MIEGGITEEQQMNHRQHRAVPTNDIILTSTQQGQDVRDSTETQKAKETDFLVVQQLPGATAGPSLRFQ
jgi:hypothetical protein